MSDASAGRRFGYWLNIFANLAVVGGIVFLAVELRQNSQMMRAQIRNEITQNVFSSIDRSMRPDVIEARVRLANGGEPLPGDELLFNGLARGTFRSIENTEYQYRMGLFDPTEYEAYLNFVHNFLQTPFIVAWWDENRQEFAVGLQQVIDSLIGQP